MKKHSLKFTSLLLSVSTLSIGLVQADTVKSIKVTGNKRIESTTVLSYIPIKPNKAYDQSELNDALKDLYNTGYFSDVQINRQADTLVIDVTENAIINQVAFEGNSKLKDDKLKEEVQLRPREVLSRTKIQSAQQRILDIYRRMGRYNATVVPKVIKQNDNRVDLVFEINEGDVTHVRKVNFIGNHHIKSSHLEKALLTKQTRWYRFFASDDTYDQDRFIADQQLLREYYYDSGYPDFRLINAVSELTPDQKDLFLTFTLEEGERYSFGKMTIQSEIKKIDPKGLYSLITYAEGDWFSRKMIEKTIQAITEAVGIQGFAFAQVEPVIVKNKDSKTVDITYEIKKGPRVYIERIEIRGNDRTRDEVIRREIRLQEGDAYNSTFVKRAEQNLNDLGYFKKVDVSIEAGSTPDKAKMIINVEEQSTGELGLAIGFSTLDRALGNIHFAERNFMGTGRTIHSDLTIASRRQEFDVGITDPYFMGYNLEVGADVFHIRSKRISAFTEQNTGGRTHLGYKLTDNWFQNWSYTLQRDQISDVPNLSSEYIKRMKGSYINSAVGHSLVYDRRNSRREPTAGYTLTFSNSLAGLGGDIGYLKNALGGSVFYSPLDEVILNARITAGHILKTNKRIRVADQIFLGADSFRGFAYGGMGPRDAKTMDAIGGSRYWVGTVEAMFPIGLPNEFGVKGALFSDFGSVWGSELKIPNNPILDKKAMRASVGVGISWDSPFGPLRIDYAIPVKKQAKDDVQRVFFGVSSRF
ncbi:outer membrane protein assembly factor BamA [Candidatus Odyssella acanthamoebae]|uniref:outer membrane protein assembly factor BamA n=1 Tax=Candidatus Odyssella acanthamoebae TaxID=91604 RepID=UPI00068E0701|nr:outer membrane protein assembly factor BamA [Candidatus Paracaedibacter acanthamoebae]